MPPQGYQDENDTPTSSSGATTPALSSSWIPAVPFGIPGLLRRFATEPPMSTSERIHSPTYPQARPGNGIHGAYTPPRRSPSPFQPPPLSPICLKGYRAGTDQSAQLLSRALAEEIRALVPPRLQLCEDWNLVYSLDQDGVSLGTLYKNCDDLRGLRNGYVLVVKDGEGGLFGAYLNEAPHPSPHYFGTGECFVWRASIQSPISLQNLPPPPSEDTTNLTRSTTIAMPKSPNHLAATFPVNSSNLAPPTPNSPAFPSGISTPDSIRFKAFMYSGVNDYMMLCETGFLSIGGGDGKYGLWLDNTFEKGISSHCLTFGNEPLSDEGEKFDIIGVELWTIGNMA